MEGEPPRRFARLPRESHIGRSVTFPIPPTMSDSWTSSSWRECPISQDVKYPDQEHLNNVTNQLKTLPGLVTSTEIDRLRLQLKEVAQGKVSRAEYIQAK